MMKLVFQYGTEALMLPTAVTAHFDRASKKDIHVLLSLAAHPLAGVDLQAACAAVAQELSLHDAEIEASLAFWRGTGILLTPETVETAKASAKRDQSAKASRPKILGEQGLPGYSSEELGGVLESRKELAGLIDACQRTFGKIFSTSEVSIIAGMVDYLNFDGEYILLLLAHCVRMEKKSLRYAEKMALTLFDEGVTEPAALEERLHRIELMASATGRIRTMFGLSSRALTAKERGMIEGWICHMQYTDDVIELAYEITVNAINKASIPYANTVLERWYAEGYKTLEDVQNAIADYRRKKTNDAASFDVDDFFEAALKRSYAGE